MRLQRFASAAGSASASALVSYNPASGVAVGEVARTAGAAGVAAALARARVAQREWAGAGLAARVGVMERAAKLLRERADSLGELLTAEMGKPLAQAKGEVRATAERLTWLAGNAEESLMEQESGVRGGARELTRYEPLGVVANIGAWNYPVRIYRERPRSQKPTSQPRRVASILCSRPPLSRARCTVAGSPDVCD